MFRASTGSVKATGRFSYVNPRCIRSYKVSSRHNPRKMVRVWAEKEMRNLKRLQTAGIRCPEPLEVRENVLVMGFIGDKDGWLVIPSLYATCIILIRLAMKGIPSTERRRYTYICSYRTLHRTRPHGPQNVQ